MSLLLVGRGSPPGLLRINAAVWSAVAIALATQEAVLHALGADPRPLAGVILRKLALLPLWAIATPAILRSASRWPARGRGIGADLLRHLAAAAGFVAATNLVIRIPVWWSEGTAAAARSFVEGVTTYGPVAVVAYAAIVLLGRSLSVPAVVAPPVASPPASWPASLPVREGDTLHLVPVSRIELLEADDNYVRVHTGERTYRVRERLSDLESRLDPARFLRIHRSAIVPIHSVRAVVPAARGDWAVTLANGARVRVARARRGLLQRALAEGRATPPGA